jgi:putative membrane protein
MRRSVGLVLGVVSLAFAGAPGCGGRSRAPAAPAPAPARPRAAEAPRFTRVPDANTAAILLASHDVDLAYARIAATRARHRDVKALARKLTTDHTRMRGNLRKLIAKLDITPTEDEVSRLLRDQSAARRDSLRALSGRRFDSAYVANELRYQQELLVAIDRVFLPSVVRPDLRQYLSSLRPAVTAHLEQAERVRTTLATRAR